MRRLALTVALLTALAAPSQADFPDGVAAYFRGDYVTALQELEPLAEQGHALAQTILGHMYVHGLGVPQDYVQAHMWLNLAASRFPQGTDRDMAVKDRDIVAAKMTPAQIAEAQKLAREWKPK